MPFILRIQNISFMQLCKLRANVYSYVKCGTVEHSCVLFCTQMYSLFTVKDIYLHLYTVA